MPPRSVRTALAPALIVAGLLAAVPAAAEDVPRRNLTLLAHRNDFPGPGGAVGYSACGAYVHGDGREFAVLGTVAGTAIYEVTLPTAPVLKAFIPGPPSVWRETKSYREWIYVVSEARGAPDAGLQIIRMSDPDHPVLAATYASDFVESHTISIDTTRALLVCNGAKNARGHEVGLRVLSLAQPEAPVELARWPAGTGPVPHEYYVHDSTPVGDRLYASMLFSGMRILDLTNPAAPSEIVSWLYDGAFSHNAALDPTGRWLYVTDEMTGEPLKVFDLAGPGNPALVNGLTSNPRAIVHNAHVRGNELYLSSYTEGVRVLDLSDPAHPAEFAWADPHPEPSGGYLGVWEVCPDFPSGIVIASDRQRGLYVFRPVRDYGILEVRLATDESAASPIACGLEGCACPAGECPCGDHAAVAPGPAGAMVRLVAMGDSLAAPADGIVRFAPWPGVRIVRASKFGYAGALGTAVVPADAVTPLALALARLPAAPFAGWLLDASTGEPIADGEIVLTHTPLHVHTDSLGEFRHAAVPLGRHRAEARAPGYAPQLETLDLGAGEVLRRYALEPAPWRESFEVESGWTVNGVGDDATSGRWIRVEPMGTGEPLPGLAAIRAGARAAVGGALPRATARAAAACEASAAAAACASGAVAGAAGRARDPGRFHEGETAAAPGEVQPERDRTGGEGQMCFVTGQGTDPLAIRQQDVDGGRTTLTSPRLDLSGFSDPIIGWWRWFHTDIHEVHDWLAVLVSADDGATWTPVDTLRGLANHWVEDGVRVRDLVAPTDRMRLRFVAADLGEESVVEAAIDEVVVYEAAPPVVSASPRPSAVRLSAARPNPSAGPVALALELPAPLDVRAEVLDLAGRAVRTLHRGRAGAGVLALVWDGADARGRAAPPGVYLVRVETRDGALERRIVRVR